METDLAQLEQILEQSTARHRYLCPRQVLGARIGLAGAAALGMDIPRHDKRLLVITETDGCFVDGVTSATGCAVGHRTLRIEDYGKVAATFVHVESNQAVRVAPQLDIRQRAWDYASNDKRRYQAMLNGYQHMPTAELLSIQAVFLSTPIESIISRAGMRVDCQDCGEEIMNERQIIQAGRTLCHACAGPAYYLSTPPSELVSNLLHSDKLTVDAEE